MLRDVILEHHDRGEDLPIIVDGPVYRGGDAEKAQAQLYFLERRIEWNIDDSIYTLTEPLSAEIEAQVNKIQTLDDAQHLLGEQ